MEDNKFEFLYLLKDLCSMYVDYISKYDDSRLEVVIQDNKINLSLYKDKEVIDVFELTFDKNENNMYIYVIIVIMKILFKKVFILNKDNIFYNDKERTNLKVIVNDKDVLGKIINFMGEISDAYIYGDIDGIKKIHIGLRHAKMIKSLKHKVDVSTKLLGIEE